jgi:GH18 family chitinase
MKKKTKHPLYTLAEAATAMDRVGRHHLAATLRKLQKQQKTIIAVGGWNSTAICPNAPEPKFKWQTRRHRFRDIAARPSGRAGERLVTSQCEYCGGLVVDCPTISL